jgi:D-sedoheptulose 7-phosphate isomerase
VTPDPAAIATAAIEGSIEAHRRLLEPACIESIVEAAGVIGRSLSGGGKVLTFGNGGSATDSSHVAAEFVGRFQRDRRALPAISLCTNDAALTAIGNDFGFEHVFARQLEALGAPGDVAIAISTSGRSENVLVALDAARRLELTTIGLTGANGGALGRAVDLCLRVPSDSTARIQEGHILIAHVLCELVEQRL